MAVHDPIMGDDITPSDSLVPFDKELNVVTLDTSNGDFQRMTLNTLLSGLLAQGEDIYFDSENRLVFPFVFGNVTTPSLPTGGGSGGGGGTDEHVVGITATLDTDGVLTIVVDRSRGQNLTATVDLTSLVPEFEVADGSIGTAKLADGAATTDKIANDAVTEGKVSAAIRERLAEVRTNNSSIADVNTRLEALEDLQSVTVSTASSYQNTLNSQLGSDQHWCLYFCGIREHVALCVLSRRW